MAYTLIASQTLLNTTSFFTFSGIPNTFKDLIVEHSGTVTAGTGIRIQLNSDTSSNYSVTILSADGSTASSTRESNQTNMRLTWNGSAQTTDPGIRTANIISYANTNINKTVLIRSNRAGSGNDAIVGLWRSTSAVNAVTLFGTDGNFIAGTTFKLWGVS